jgi:hypothetical protein
MQSIYDRFAGSLKRRRIKINDREGKNHIEDESVIASAAKKSHMHVIASIAWQSHKKK